MHSIIHRHNPRTTEAKLILIDLYCTQTRNYFMLLSLNLSGPCKSKLSNIGVHCHMSHSSDQIQLLQSGTLWNRSLPKVNIFLIFKFFKRAGLQTWQFRCTDGVYIWMSGLSSFHWSSGQIWLGKVWSVSWLFRGQCLFGQIRLFSKWV